jgi:AcrR family transcriptional regulator
MAKKAGQGAGTGSRAGGRPTGSASAGAGGPGSGRAGGPADSRGLGQSRSAELLWGEPGRPNRGPKPGLSVERIVRAAIDIADAEGLGAVSMQRVAGEFGFTTMSLYRYVPGKSELIDLMIDTAVGQPPDLSSINGGWRPKLAEWARLTFDCFRRHPWFLAEALHRIVGPNQLGFLESAVAAFRGTVLTGEEIMGSVLAVNGFVRSFAPFAADVGAAEPGEWEQAITGMIRQHADRFPALTAVMAEAASGPPQFDDFEFGLQRVLDGIEVYMERGAARR